jgi:hypothetical protein
MDLTVEGPWLTKGRNIKGVERSGLLIDLASKVTFTSLVFTFATNLWLYS